MARKAVHQDESTGAAEDKALSPETPLEDELGVGTAVMEDEAVLARDLRDGDCPHRREAVGAEIPSALEVPGQGRWSAEAEEHPLELVDTVRRFSPGGSAKYAVRAACYVAGRAADKLVSLYRSAFTLDRDYIVDFNKSAGVAHARHRRWDKAIPLLEKSLEMAPDDLEVRMRLAEAYNAENEPEKACYQLGQILALDPSSGTAWRALGVIHAGRQDYDRAVECLEEAVKLEPEHSQTHYRLGMAYDNKKQYGKAVEAFRKAIRLDPRFAKAYQALGFTYESMGNRESAVECFKRALELE